jgi:membrane protein CcdC involved in cytochrome C biogenesis
MITNYYGNFSNYPSYINCILNPIPHGVGHSSILVHNARKAAKNLDAFLEKKNHFTYFLPELLVIKICDETCGNNSME